MDSQPTQSLRPNGLKAIGGQIVIALRGVKTLDRIKKCCAFKTLAVLCALIVMAHSFENCIGIELDK